MDRPAPARPTLGVASAVKAPDKGSQLNDALRDFGEQLRQWRQAAGLRSQREAAATLSGFGKGVSTSLLAQLEAGRITNIGHEHLQAIAAAYNVAGGYDAVLARYNKYRFGLSEVKCKLIEQDLKDISGLAAWERSAKVKSLWIVTQRILEDENPEIQDAIIDLLNRGATIQYFASSQDAYSHWLGELATSFTVREQELQKKFDDVKGQIDFMPILDNDLAFMTSSIVIANPTDLIANVRAEDTEAYLVFSAELTPAFGLRITNATQLRKVVIRLQQKLVEYRANRAALANGRDTK